MWKYKNLSLDQDLADIQEIWHTPLCFENRKTSHDNFNIKTQLWCCHSVNNPLNFLHYSSSVALPQLMSFHHFVQHRSTVIEACLPFIYFFGTFLSWFHFSYHSNITYREKFLSSRTVFLFIINTFLQVNNLQISFFFNLQLFFPEYRLL